MKEILIQLTPCNQHDAKHDSEWAHRICAICSLWVLLKLNNPKFNISVMDLVKKGLDRDGYIEGVGWKHASVVEVAKDFGLELKYIKKFFYTTEEKEAGLMIINQNLENDQPVLVSVRRPPNSHILIINGLKEEGGEIIGYFVQDSDGRFRGHNYFLTKSEFLVDWRGGLIYGHSSLDEE